MPDPSEIALASPNCVVPGSEVHNLGNIEVVGGEDELQFSLRDPRITETRELEFGGWKNRDGYRVSSWVGFQHNSVRAWPPTLVYARESVYQLLSDVSLCFRIVASCGALAEHNFASVVVLDIHGCEALDFTMRRDAVAASGSPNRERSGGGSAG